MYIVCELQNTVAIKNEKKKSNAGYMQIWLSLAENFIQLLVLPYDKNMGKGGRGGA